MQEDDEPLTEAAVKAMTKMSKSTRYRLRLDGKFPPLVTFSPHVQLNTRGQIRRWLAERVREAEAVAEIVK